MLKHAKYLFILTMLIQNLQASLVNNTKVNTSKTKIKDASELILLGTILTNKNLDAKEKKTITINSNIESLYGPQIINGKTLLAKDQVLLTGQIDKEQNGLWVVQYLEWEKLENKNSIDADLEFIFQNEQTSITKAGNNVTAENFSAINIVVKTDGTPYGVTGSGITIDTNNNIAGVNTLNATSVSMPTTNVSSPAIIFPGVATNTGIYSATTDEVDISSKGSKIAAFNPTGVYIAPGKSLTVNGQTTFNNTATFNNASTFNNTVNINGTNNLKCTTNLIGTTNIPSGTTTINGKINITGTTNISGPTTIIGTTNISGNTNITGTTNISIIPSLTSSINLSPSGSQASPSITFNNDLTSGIYSPSAQNISISTSGGDQKLNIYATGISATSLYLSGDISVSNNITGANIVSSATINTSSAINASDVYITGPLNVNGTTNLNGTLTATGGVQNLAGSLNATGTTNILGILSITGVSTINGTVNATGISMSGDISLGGKNVTGAHAVNATGLVLQPGTATGPSLTFNGNTSAGLSCTSANTLNFSGGPIGINTQISPSGVSILSGGLNFSNVKYLNPNYNVNLDDPINFYAINDSDGLYTYQSSYSNPIGKTIMVANQGNSSCTIHAILGNVSDEIVLLKNQLQILTCTNILGHAWALSI